MTVKTAFHNILPPPPQPTIDRLGHPVIPTAPRQALSQPERPCFLIPATASLILPLYDLINSLQYISLTPHFSHDTRNFLICQLEKELTAPEATFNFGIFPPSSNVFLKPAKILHHLHSEGKIDLQWAQRLITATRKDIMRPTCTSWADLLLYCRYTAEPIARSLLDAYKISSLNTDLEKGIDALYAAIIIQNKLENARADWVVFGRCYLPLDWIREEQGSPEHLIENQLTPALRRTSNRILARTTKLLSQARHLPEQLNEFPSLKAEMTRQIILAKHKNNLLARNDFLSTQLKISRWVRFVAYLEGWLASRA